MVVSPGRVPAYIKMFSKLKLGVAIDGEYVPINIGAFFFPGADCGLAHPSAQAAPARLSAMTAVTFDTLKCVKTLQAAGVAMPQAEAIAAAVRDSTDSAELATKADLRELKAVLKSDLRELELSMTIKLGGMLVVAVGILAAIIKL